MRVFNLGNVLATGEQIKGQKLRNEITGMQRDAEVRAEETRKKVRQARLMFDNAGDAIAQLQADGNFAAAEQLRNTVRQQYAGTISILENAREWVTADNYKEVRSQLLSEGVIDPEDMPVEYSGSYFDRKIKEAKNKLSKIELTQGTEDGGVETQEAIYDEYGNVVRQGEPYDPRTLKPPSGGGAGDKFKYTSSDVNAINRLAGQIYGGVWDPSTGRFAGLDPQQAAKVQALVERAERIYRESGGSIAHGQAVSDAARQMQVNVPDLTNELTNDPLGLRTRQ